MKPSGWAPLGLFKLKGGEYPAKAPHAALVRLLGGDATGGFSGELGSVVDALAYSTAHLLAVADGFVERVWRQRFASTVYENLAAEEAEHGLHPGPDATVRERRAALAARKLIPKGSARAPLEEALRALLGDDYVGIHVTSDSERVVWPSALGDQPQLLQAESIDRKLVQILDTISIGLGAPQTVRYEGVLPTTNGSEHTLRVGDRLLVEPEILGRAEVVTVTAVQQVIPLLAPAYLLFEATFNQAHEPSCLASTSPFPLWTSSQCELLIVVTQTAAVTIETRRQVHELLARLVTGVTTWALVQQSTDGVAGPFTLDDPVLGMLDVNPLDEATVP